MEERDSPELIRNRIISKIMQGRHEEGRKEKKGKGGRGFTFLPGHWWCIRGMVGKHRALRNEEDSGDDESWFPNTSWTRAFAGGPWLAALLRPPYPRSHSTCKSQKDDENFFFLPRDSNKYVTRYLVLTIFRSTTRGIKNKNSKQLIKKRGNSRQKNIKVCSSNGKRSETIAQKRMLHHTLKHYYKFVKFE